jgi:hypothetical protein
MTKGEKLIWELFLMVKEINAKVGVTAADTERQNEWAKVFHEMEHPEPAAAEAKSKKEK